MICITETWLNDSIPNALINVDGYYISNELRVDRNDTLLGRGGGLIVFIRNDVNVVPIVNHNLSFNQFCKFEIILNKKCCPLIITLIYRSPNSNEENNLALSKLIDKSEKNCLIIGDFNFPNCSFNDGVSDAKSRPVAESTSARFLTNIVDFPTHIRGNILDIALVDNETKNRVLGVANLGNLGNSDHAIIGISISVTPEMNEGSELVHNWRKGDEVGLSRHLQNIDFEAQFQDKNVTEAWDLFKTTIYDAINRYIPLSPRRKKGDPPWMSRKVKRLVNRKQKFWKRFSKDRSDENFARYKTAEKECKKGVSDAKRKFERNIAKSGNKRPFNAYVKSKTKSREGVGPLKVNGNLISDSEAMANKLNEFFTSVFGSEAQGPVPRPPQLPVQNELQSTVFSVAQVRKKLLCLKPNSAPGPDKVANRLLKANANSLAPALTAIFNKSMEEGVVPEDWRCAHVTPIFKKGSKFDPSNYRPVSLTSVPCRVMESCLKDTIVDHLVANSLIQPSQHGFMKNKSCTTNLLQFLERVTSEVDVGNPVDIIYLDFAKAFDKVPHRRLLEKFKAHGVSGRILTWIKEWLTDRTQRTVLNGAASDWSAVTSGVPQGSVLGPLAFVVYINDLDDETTEITIANKFADDTKCGQVVTSPEQVATMQQCLDNLVSWADRWGMSFNVAKCKVMHVGKHNQGATYNMGGVDLASTEEERDIGIRVHKSLKPSAQCQEASRRAMAVLGQISRAFHYRDRRVFINLYKQYVRPHVEFACPAWSPWTVADKTVVERVQERAVKMISGLKGADYAEKLAELRMLSLEDRRTLYDLVQVYKIVHKVDDVPYGMWFELVGNTPGRVTRFSQDPLNIVTKPSRTDLRRNFFSQRVISKWNDLPASVKAVESVKVFKSYIEEMLLKN